MSINQNVLEWYNGLDIRSKYRYENEANLHAAITADVGFVEMIQLRSALSKNLLKDVLNRKSRVIVFGAGGTASWFLPKLLKIYNDAFTKCPEQAYDLEIVVMDHDEVETKNIIRQNFINEDVGQKKSDVLAERYNGLYPRISVVSIPLYGTSVEYDQKVSKLEKPLDQDVFFNIDDYIQSSDIVVNLVDNEVFKRKIDYVIYKKTCLVYFNAGINLFNGQCYVSYPVFTNLYTLDHPSFIDDVEEVKVHSCADADAEGTADNPEQMFNGNDMAASILANLYQTAIADCITHRKIKFTCGINVSIEKELPTHASVLFAGDLSRASHPDEIFDMHQKVYNLSKAAHITNLAK